MAKQFDSIAFSKIVEIRDALLRLDDPARLESGDPEYSTPEHIKEAAKRALDENQTHYVASDGIAPLRDALSKKLTEQNQIPNVTPHNVIATNGGMHALYVLYRALLEDGEEVLMPDPNWTCVTSLVMCAGGVPKRIRLIPEAGFTFDWDLLEFSVGPKTRALHINTPQNPTGAVWGVDELRRLLAFAERHNLFVVSDEAYEHIVYDGLKHVSTGALIGDFPGLEDKVASVFTFSKSYAMTGWRLGYLHLNNKEVFDRVRKAVLYTCNGVSSITQYAGLAAIEGPQDCTREFCASFQEKRDLFYDALKDVPIFDVRKPKGAFYFFPRITEAYRGVDGDRSDVALCKQLIAEAQIGNTPGRIFGRCGEGFLRFSYACSLRHIERAADTLRQLFAGVVVA